MSSSPPAVCLPSPIAGVEVEHTLPWSHHQSIDRVSCISSRAQHVLIEAMTLYFCNQTHLCYLFCTSASIHQNKNDNMITINNLIQCKCYTLAQLTIAQYLILLSQQSNISKCSQLHIATGTS